MSIKKQEFYEGAAIHLLLRGVGALKLRYNDPYFVVDDGPLVYLKYSTKGRSPWGFSLNGDERKSLENCALKFDVIVGLICADDGVAAIKFNHLREILDDNRDACHISCYRKHNEHYEINGPSGTLPYKVPPSGWLRILDK